MARKFAAPKQNPYGGLIQSAETNGTQTGAPEYYRFNAKMPMICKDYLQEMAWRNRTTITDYLIKLITADMDAHPEWVETIDVLNK